MPAICRMWRNHSWLAGVYGSPSGILRRKSYPSAPRIHLGYTRVLGGGLFVVVFGGLCFVVVVVLVVGVFL